MIILIKPPKNLPPVSLSRFALGQSRVWNWMLKGRESLIRLVGKRRRFLPNRDVLLSLPPFPNGFVESVNGGEGSPQCKTEEGPGDGGGGSDENGARSDWVSCPVCGDRVRGDGYAINSHLDVCLSRGTKRKLMQRTLLQLNFTPKSKIRVHSDAAEQLISSADHILSLSSPSNVSAQEQVEVDEVESRRGSLFATFSAENPTCNNGIYNSVKIPSEPVSLKNEYPHDNVDVHEEGMCRPTLETFIVGRKFSDEKELKQEMVISLMREPDNLKDSNAIKVLSGDAGCPVVLGYLPRGLAQFISPLIENYSLHFEGTITSVPDHYLDAVPIQISCNEILSTCGKEFNDIESIRSWWRHALEEAEALKKNPPNLAKYQQNFCILLREVLKSSPQLLTDDERNFFESFMALPNDSQRLFIRLYTRKGPWFRVCNISYPEISDVPMAVKNLSGAGYIITFDDAWSLNVDDLKGLLRIFTVPELRDIWSIVMKNNSKGSRKKDLIASLLSVFEDGLCPTLSSLIFKRSGMCIRISSKAEFLFWRAERLFFLNGEQNLSAFLLVDLGIVKYPTYTCIITDQIFASRSDLLAYEEAVEVAQLIDEALDENNSDKVLKCMMIADSHLNIQSAEVKQSSTLSMAASFFSCFTAAWVYSKVLLLGVSFLERERRYVDAIRLLKRLLSRFIYDRRRGYWTVRLSVDLEHIGHLDESLSVAEDGLEDPFIRAGSRLALQKRILRLAKPPRRWKVPSFQAYLKKKIPEVHVQGRPLNCEMGKKSRFYGDDGEQCGVEQLALQYYASKGEWHGVHTESGIWLTIFALLMWDVMFSDVPNVFQSKFQSYPLDLETDSFYNTRKNLVESHLKNVQEGVAEEILITSWDSHYGTVCKGVNWDRHSLSELRAAVTCVGGSCLAALCRLLAQDYRSWSSGMPDLLLWRFHGEYKGEAKLVEVKGPKDRLSEQQEAWILLLMDCGFNAEVCKVSPACISA